MPELLPKEKEEEEEEEEQEQLPPGLAFPSQVEPDKDEDEEPLLPLAPAPSDDEVPFYLRPEPEEPEEEPFIGPAAPPPSQPTRADIIAAPRAKEIEPQPEIEWRQPQLQSERDRQRLALRGDTLDVDEKTFQGDPSELLRYGVIPISKDESLEERDFDWSGRGIRYKKVPPPKEGEEYRSPNPVPHPSDNRIKGMHYDDQMVMWYHLNPEGRKAWASKPFNRDKIYWDIESGEWEEIPSTTSLGFKFEGMEGYTPPREGYKETALWSAIWGLPEHDIKKYEDRSGFEKYGLMGLLTLEGEFEKLGVDKLEQRMGKAYGVAGAGSIKGMQMGAKLPGPLKPYGAGIGAVLGGMLGMTLGKPAVAGELATPAEVAEMGVYGMMGGTGGTASGFISRLGIGALEGFAISEAAHQAQTILDDKEALPMDWQSVVTRNLTLAAMGGVFKGVGGLKPKAEPFDREQLFIAIDKGVRKSGKEMLRQRIELLRKKSTGGKTRGKRNAAKKERKKAQGFLNKMEAEGANFTVSSPAEAVYLSQIIRAQASKKSIRNTIDGMTILTQDALQEAVALGKPESEIAARILALRQAKVPESDPRFIKNMEGLSDVLKHASSMVDNESSMFANPSEKAFLNWWQKFRTQMITEATPMGVAQEKIRRHYGPDDMSPIEWDFDFLPGAMSKGWANVLKFDADVSSKLTDKFVHDKFVTYMILKRIQSRLKAGLTRDKQIIEIDGELASARAFRTELRGDDPKAKKTIEENIEALLEIKRGLKKQSDRRVAYANARGEVQYYTPEDVGTALSDLKLRVGPAAYANLEKIGVDFQRHAGKHLDMIVSGGLLSKAQAQMVRAKNDWYTPFRVSEYLKLREAERASGRSSRTSIINAITGIDNPTLKIAEPINAYRQIIMEQTTAVEKNRALLKLMEMYRRDLPINVPAGGGKDLTGFMRQFHAADEAKNIGGEGLFIRQLKGNMKPAEGQGKFTVMVDGKPLTYEVDQSVAKAIKSFTNEESANWIAKFLGTMNKPFKVGAVKWNAGFQLVNAVLSDLPTNALTSRIGLQAHPRDWADFITDYLWSLGVATRGNMGPRGRNVLSKAGEKVGLKISEDVPEFYLEALQAGLLKQTMNHAITLDRSLQPNLAGFTGKLAGLRGIGRATVEVFDILPNAIEEMGKIVAIRRSLRLGKEATPLKYDLDGVSNMVQFFEKNPEWKREVIQMSGSPQFTRFGASAKNADLLFMFFNARMQGAARDLERITDWKSPEGRKAMARVGLVVGLPTIYNTARNLTEYREDWDKVPMKVKRNNWVVFKAGDDAYVKTEDGQMMREYYPVPKRDMVRVIANLTEMTIEQFHTKDPDYVKRLLDTAASDISPIDFSGDGWGERFATIFSQTTPPIKYVYEAPKGDESGPYKSWQTRYLMSSDMAESHPSEQYRETTPELWIKAANQFQIISDATGVELPEVLRSPIQFEYAVETATAKLFTQFIQGKVPEGRKDDWRMWAFLRPVMTRFTAPLYLQNEKMVRAYKKVKREGATEKVHADHEADKWIAKHVEGRMKYKRGPMSGAKRLEVQMAMNKAFPGMSSQNLVRRAITRKMKVRLAGKTYEFSGWGGLPDKQLAKMIRFYLKSGKKDWGWTPEESDDAMEVFEAQGFMSKGVWREFLKLEADNPTMYDESPALRPPDVTPRE